MLDMSHFAKVFTALADYLRLKLTYLPGLNLSLDVLYKAGLVASNQLGPQNTLLLRSVVVSSP